MNNKATVTYEIEISEEDIRPEDQFDSGDEADDKELVSEIYRRLENGDLWAWCCVCVVAKLGGFEGCAYLGGCSYKDEDDFKDDGGYYPQLKEEALADLKATLEDARDRGEVAVKFLESLGG